MGSALKFMPKTPVTNDNGKKTVATSESKTLTRL